MLPRLYHMSLISKPICLLMSWYLKHKQDQMLRRSQVYHGIEDTITVFYCMAYCMCKVSEIPI